MVLLSGASFLGGGGGILTNYIVIWNLSSKLSCLRPSKNKNKWNLLTSFSASSQVLTLHMQAYNFHKDKSILYMPDVIVISEVYFWISSLFLAPSELWLAGLTQLFWLRFLSKLTGSNGVFSASYWFALLGKTSSQLQKLHCTGCMNSTELNWTQLTCITWTLLHYLNSTELSSTPWLSALLWSSLFVCSRKSWIYLWYYLSLC